MPTLPEFVARWRGSTLTERAASQTHFIELCQVLGQPYPAQVDMAGENYGFERGAARLGQADGWADVWMRGHFAWEYKGPRHNLVEAYQQLLLYREDLDNPPLLVVSDMDRFEVHTNFTNTSKKVFAFRMADLLTTDPVPGSNLTALQVLGAVFTDFNRLRPGQTTADVTRAAATEFADLAEALADRGHQPLQVARFLMRLLFCLFAEDIELLPDKLFKRLLGLRGDPRVFDRQLSHLFATMSTGGAFGAYQIPWVDGGIFDDAETIELTAPELDVLARAAELDWSSIEPAIFGTLFTRSLDPEQRSQLGAEYTSREDIELVVEPVVMAPLRRRWEQVQEQARTKLDEMRVAPTRARETKLRNDLANTLFEYQGELRAVRILDPACGSGNFLYVTLRALLDLEKQVSIWAANNGLPHMIIQVDPSQLHGIEINPYAQQIASVTVWIGYLQWLRDNGWGTPTPPILRALDNIHLQDAVLGRDPDGGLFDPPWPEADYIIGNPPFLGSQFQRARLGGQYVEALRTLFAGRIPGQSDLVCYWFERARAIVERNPRVRVGLLATQGIRGGANRRVLENIKRSGDIFFAISDRVWPQGDDVAVHVSMIGFDSGREPTRVLDAREVVAINADLTAGVDVTQAVRLLENRDVAYQGPVKVGPFEISAELARGMLARRNPRAGYPNSDVVVPWANGSDITGRPRGMYIINFGERSMEEAAYYEAPFEYVRQVVKPVRENNNDERRRTNWWRLGASGRDFLRARQGLSCIIVTPRVGKHRIFAWAPIELIPDSALVAFTRDDDYAFGVLQSRVHELWARRAGTQLREAESGFRYTPRTVFEKFPFPWPLGTEPREDADPKVRAIAEAATQLVADRDGWLDRAGLIPEEAAQSTLTDLYNQYPTWLELDHRRLDNAVLDAYGWPHDATDGDILACLLALNHARAGL